MKNLLIRKKISNLFNKNKYEEDKELFELACSEISPSNYRAALFYGLQNMKPNLDSTTDTIWIGKI